MHQKHRPKLSVFSSEYFPVCNVLLLSGTGLPISNKLIHGGTSPLLDIAGLSVTLHWTGSTEGKGNIHLILYRPNVLHSSSTQLRPVSLTFWYRPH